MTEPDISQAVDSASVEVVADDSEGTGDETTSPHAEDDDPLTLIGEELTDDEERQALAGEDTD